MSEPAERRPAGAGQAAGISHTPSPFPFGDTVDRLTEAIRAAGATLFAIVDHSGEAERARLSLRPTKLVIFGSPVAGTPVMVAAWLAGRHGIPPGLAAPLAAAGALAGRVAGRILEA